MEKVISTFIGLSSLLHILIGGGQIPKETRNDLESQGEANSEEPEYSNTSSDSSDSDGNDDIAEKYDSNAIETDFRVCSKKRKNTSNDLTILPKVQKTYNFSIVKD